MSSDSVGRSEEHDLAPLSAGAPGPDGPVLWRGEVKTSRRRGADKPGDLLRLLARAKRNAALYGAGHPFILETFRSLHEVLQEVLANRPALRIFIHEDTFFVENTILLEDSLQLQALLQTFVEREVTAIQLDAGVEATDLQHLVEILNLEPKELQRRGGAPAYLEEHGVQRITLGAMRGTGMGGGVGGKAETSIAGAILPSKRSSGGQAELGAKLDPQDAYRAGLRLQDELTYQASANLPLNLRKAHLVINSFIDVIADDGAALPGIAILKNYDEETYHHSVNVAILSLLIGSRLKLSRELLVALGLAALLHDIGKVRVPLEILAKPAKLTPEEMAVIKRHPIFGAHALRDLPGLSRLALVVAFEHHANYNLSGYPRIVEKKMPHLLSRIVHVADAYDAMTSTRRVYRRPLEQEEAFQIILDGAGTIYDPVVAKLSLQILTTLSRQLTGRVSEPHN